MHPADVTCAIANTSLLPSQEIGREAPGLKSGEELSPADLGIGHRGGLKPEVSSG